MVRPKRPSMDWSGNEAVDDLTANISQPEVTSLEAIRQSRVVEAEEVENGRMEIVNVDGVFDDVPAKFIRFAKDLPAFNAAAGHPNTESKRMMIASRDLFVTGAVLPKR